MPSFSYVAIDKDGKEKKASLEAESLEKATDIIRKAGLTPIDVKEAGVLGKELTFSVGKKVKARELGIFCKQFYSMLSAGVTIIDALGMMSDQTENKKLKLAIQETKKNVEQGHTMSEAMEQNRALFGDMLVDMVAAGETSGNVEIAFSRMAVQFEKSAKTSGMLKKAMAYPAVLLLVTLAILVVMLVKVIPGYAATFAEGGMELPAITKGMMSMSDNIQQYWYLYIIAIIGIIIGIKVYSKTDSGRHVFGKLALKMPIFGNLNTKTYASQFARTLSTLIYAGIPLIDGIESVTRIMSNQIYIDHLKKVREEVAKGVPLSEPMREGGLFPPMVTHMVAVGEETGDIEGMLNNLADYYDEEVEMATQTVMAAMEPMIIVVMAIIVVVLIIGIYAPMLSMYDQLGSM